MGALPAAGLRLPELARLPGVDTDEREGPLKVGLMRTGPRAVCGCSSMLLTEVAARLRVLSPVLPAWSGEMRGPEKPLEPACMIVLFFGAGATHHNACARVCAHECGRMPVFAREHACKEQGKTKPAKKCMLQT